MDDKEIFHAAMQMIRQEINARPLTDFVDLEKSKGGLYCCPICGSGNGANGTGALKLYRDGRVFCHANHCFTDKGEDVCGALCRIWGCSDYDMMLRAGYDVQEYKQRVQQGQKPAARAQQPQEEEPQADFSAYYDQARARITDPDALMYLSSRRISLETAQRMGLGYDAKWRSPKALKEGKNPPYSPRIIIPTSSTHYIARDVRPEVKDFAKMNEGRPCLFNVDALYNVQGKPVFVVEGAFDALSIIEVGGQAVALNSTSNYTKLLEILKEKPTRNVLVISQDNDPAGQKAAAALAEGLQAASVAFVTADICCGCKDPNEALQERTEAFRAIVQATEKAQQPGRRMVESFLQAIQTERYKPVPTGLKPLDDMIHGGFIMQTLVMIGAAPGMGKTAFAQQLFEGMAAQGRNVVYFNLEMSKEQMIARSLSRIAHQRHGATMAAIDVLQGYRWTDAQKHVMMQTADEYAQEIAPHMVYNPGNTGADLTKILALMDEVAARAKEAGKPAPLVVIDYMHLLRGEGREDVQETIKRAADLFKKYAIENNSIVFAIIAHNRGSNKASKTTQDSGRDSSAIEYGADLMLALNYAKLEELPTNADQADIDAAREKEANKPEKEYLLKVTKDRLQGGTGNIKMTFEGKYSLFTPVSQGYATWSSPVQTAMPIPADEDDEPRYSRRRKW